MSKISVIILAYNAEKYLKNSINSIIKQTYKNWKLIVVNDGSTDETLEIIKSYKNLLKKNLTIINNTQNIGINGSMNLALKEVNTPYFTRQDADDISFPNRLEISLNNLLKKKEYYFVSSRMRSINEDIIYPYKIIEHPSKFDLYKKFSFCNAPILYKSEILKKVHGYNMSPSYKKRYEDYEFIFNCYKNNFKGFNIKDITYCVRQDTNYYKKITIVDRIVEAKLKYKIFKDFKISKFYFFYIFTPIIKLLIPNSIFKILVKLNNRFI